jgi:hypothetical protein
MKNILMAAIISLVAFSSQAEAARKNRNFAAVCSNVRTAGSASNTIYKNSAPLRSGGVGTPLIGYRKEPTLIMNTNISSRGTKSVYDSNGNRLTSCPWASAEGHGGGRFRCTIQTASLRGAAVRNTRSPAVFFNVSGKTCIKVEDAGRCYGSVKGLCNQTIK